MNTQMILKRFLAVVCVLALCVSVFPVFASASEVDLEAIYSQIAAAQAQAQAQAQQMQELYAAAQAQAQQMQELQKEAQEQQFDVEAVFELLSSLKTGEEKEAFFNSLTEIQQKLLVEYVKKLITEDKFHGFDDFEFPAELLAPEEDIVSGVESAVEEVSEKKNNTTLKDSAETDTFPVAKDTPAETLSEEQMFYNDYENYINLYKQFGTYADLSGVSYEVQQQIKALVDGAENELKAEPAEDPAMKEVAEIVDEDNLKDMMIFPDQDVSFSVPEFLPESPKAVTITSSLTDTVAPGDPIVLTGILEDADHYNDVIYLWEVDKGTGTYEIVPDATGPVYTFPASAEALRWNWRLSVLYR